MNELCFASNLSSSEWAAWMQAIGSIGAILAAVWIMDRQHRVELERQNVARHVRIKSTYEIIRVAATSMKIAPSAVSQFDNKEMPDSVMHIPEKVLQAAVRNVVSHLAVAAKTLDSVQHQMLDEPVLCGIVARMRQSAEISLAIIDDAREADFSRPYSIANIAWTTASNAARSAAEFEEFLGELAGDSANRHRMIS